MACFKVAVPFHCDAKPCKFKQPKTIHPKRPISKVQISHTEIRESKSIFRFSLATLLLVGHDVSFAFGVPVEPQFNRYSSLEQTQNGGKLVIPVTQWAQRTCFLLALPQLGHLTRAVTSFNALPAICLERFFEYEVFFFGTALSKPSHSSCNSDEMEIPSNGTARAAAAEGGSRILCRAGILRSGREVYGTGWKKGSSDWMGNGRKAIADRN